MQSDQAGQALFKQFFQKMNNDLAKWLIRQRDSQQLREDYNNTLVFLRSHYSCPKLMVEIGSGCLSKAKRVNDKIIVRCRQDLYVQMSQQQALPMVEGWIGLCDERLSACKQEIAKIMASIREMERLIATYQQLM